MANQKLLDGLVKTLALEKFEENLFRGQSEKTSWGRVFGGQVIGQALSAASQTVESSRIALRIFLLLTKPTIFSPSTTGSLR